MPKVCSISDIHCDENSRFEETCGILEWLGNDIESQFPDLITIAGDSLPVSVRASTPVERRAFGGFLKRLSLVAPVVVITGNHDISAFDIHGFNDPERRIYVYDKPEVFELAGCVVGVLPWPSKAFLMSHLPEGTSKDSIDEACRAAMNSILRLFTVKFSEVPWPRVLVAHLNCAGADVGGFALIGQDVEVSAEALEATGADFCHLGHVHTHQIMGSKGIVAYSGSPRRVSFSEQDEEKGYLCTQVQRGETPVIHFKRTPLTVMQTISVDAGSPFAPEERVTPGAELRLLISLTEDQREGFDLDSLKRQICADQASSIKVEFRVQPKQRVRAPEIQKATSDADRLLAYLGTLESKPDQEQTQRLLLKLATLQEA